MKYESEKSGKDVQVIVFINIGPCLDPNYPAHAEIYKEIMGNMRKQKTLDKTMSISAY